MPEIINPDKIKIGYVVLIAGRKPAIEKLQHRLGFGESAKWTHVTGSLGGYNIIDASFPRSRITDLQKRYVDKGCLIKVLRRRGQQEKGRYKTAIWWAAMNNLPYDIMQFLWFPASVMFGRIGLIIQNIFSSRKRLLCSELIADGFYKEGDFLFAKPAEKVLPADFDNPALFEEISDIWL